MFENHTQRRKSKLPLVVSLIALVVVAAIVLFVPWPHTVKSTFTLEPASTTSVMAPRAGQLTEVKVKEGDVVKKGDVLATYDTAAAAALQQDLEAQLAELQKKADATGLTAALDRVKRAEEQPASPDDLDRAHEALTRLEQKPAVAELAAQLTSVQDSLTRAQAEQQETSIVAPASGTVAKLSATASASVTEGQALAIVEETERIKAVVSVPAGETVAPGQVMTLELPNAEKRRVRLEDGPADGKVEAVLENPTGELEVGTSGVARIEGQNRSILLGQQKTVSMR